MSFGHRGLVINRRIASATQSVFDITTMDGETLVNGFDGSSDYDHKAMCNFCDDGRINPWMKTDWEIKIAINNFLEIGKGTGQGNLVDLIITNIKD